MAGPTQTGRGIISGINVTPLVDIVLVLLIIFMVTAKIVVSPAVPLDLPRATEGRDVQVVFSVLLPSDGRLLVDGTPVSGEGALEAQARRALAEEPELRAVIQADGAVPHRRVIGTLDALKRAGVTRIAFGALPETAPSPEAAPE
ncbi:MAG: ExbD/TolR family protein [Myxococcota bacterium]